MTDDQAKDSIIAHLERELKEARMTMRDRFAEKAIPWVMENCVSDPVRGLTWQQVAADQAYLMADVMMEARKK